MKTSAILNSSALGIHHVWKLPITDFLAAQIEKQKLVEKSVTTVGYLGVKSPN